jgi:hypothetical protein
MNDIELTVIDRSKFTTYAVKRMLEARLIQLYGNDLHKESYVEQSQTDKPVKLELYYSVKKHVATWNKNDRSGWIFC